jgi:vacuolar-type H+-ATPase subunit C/Vma6
MKLHCLHQIFIFLAPFFEECINEQDLDEMNIEIIRNTLYKSYLEAFYNFCKTIGGTTQDVMCEILAVSVTGFCFNPEIVCNTALTTVMY